MNPNIQTGDVTSGTKYRDGVSIAEYTLSNRPNSSEFGKGLAIVDGTLFYSDGNNWTSTLNKADFFKKTDRVIGAIFGHSFSTRYTLNSPILSYSKSDGVATLLVDNASVVFSTSTGLVITGGSSLPDEYKCGLNGDNVVIPTSVVDNGSTLTIKYAIKDTGTGSGTPNHATARAWTAYGTGIGNGKGSQSFVSWIDVITKGAISVPDKYCFGYGGSKLYDAAPHINEILDQMDSPKPSIIFIQYGTNDINPVISNTYSFDYLIGLYSKIIDACVIRRIFPIIELIYPSDLGLAWNNMALRVNNKLKALSRERGDFLTLDPHPYVVDPASATGEMRSAVTSDGLHPNAKAAAGTAKVYLGNELKELIPIRSNPPRNQGDLYHIVNNPTGNLLSQAQGNFTSTVGAITLTNSNQDISGWKAKRDATGTGTITAEVAARTDTWDTGETVIGNELIIEFTNTVSSSSVTIDLNVSPFWGRIIISSMSAASGVVTVNANAHGMVDGETVSVRDCTVGACNGINMPITYVTANQFTYTPTLSPPNGSITVSPTKMVRSLGAGDRVYFECEYEITDVSGLSAFKAPNLQLKVYGGPSNGNIYQPSVFTQQEDVYPLFPTSGLLRTTSVCIPNDTSWVIPFLNLLNVVCTGLKFKIKHFAMRKEDPNTGIDW